MESKILDLKNVDVELIAVNTGINVDQVKSILDNEEFIINDNTIVRLPANNQLTLDNVKSNRIFTSEKGWQDMTPAERFYYMDLMKKYLLNKCRSGSRAYRAINNISLDTIENIKSDAITRRLMFEKRRLKIIYTPGQDEIWEREQLKKNIIRACY